MGGHHNSADDIFVFAICICHFEMLRHYLEHDLEMDTTNLESLVYLTLQLQYFLNPSNSTLNTTNLKHKF